MIVCPSLSQQSKKVVHITFPVATTCRGCPWENPAVGWMTNVVGDWHKKLASSPSATVSLSAKSTSAPPVEKSRQLPFPPQLPLNKCFRVKSLSGSSLPPSC